MTVCAQNGFQYQAVVRNIDGSVIANHNINIKFSMIQNSADGEIIYSETQQVKTSSDGLLNVEIGKGNVITGDFNQINWAKGLFFIKTEIDKGDGFTNSGTQELLSVPYVNASEKAGGIQKKSINGTSWEIMVDNNGGLTASPVVDSIIPIPNGYSKLVFNDEFNGTGLPDSNKWGYEIGYVRNRELQYYTNKRIENCYQSEGCLNLVILNDSAVIGGVVRPITSASIHTKDKAEWLYGRIEVRAKLPMCLGTWPAIWMMPAENTYGGWPSSGEIDIMENVGYDSLKIVYTIHSLLYNGMTGIMKTKSVFCGTCFTDFHVYALEWSPNKIEWFLDGEKRFTQTNTQMEWQSWPFDHPFYLILNSAFGGSWGGKKGVNLKGLPQKYLIDYVRVFQ